MNLKFKRKLTAALSILMLFTIVFGNVLSVGAADVDETVRIEETGTQAETENIETEAQAETENAETEAVSYAVHYNIDAPDSARAYVGSQEVTYDGTVAEDGRVIFEIIPESQFEVDVESTIVNNPTLEIHQTSREDVVEFEVDEVVSDITINISTKKISEEESEEPQSEETAEEAALKLEEAGERSLARARSYDLYCYTLVPGMSINDNVAVDKMWNGMGVGTVSNVNAPTLSGTSGVNFLEQGASYTLPSQMPDITVNGQSYRYAAPESGNENTKGYYTIEWIRIVAAAGANAGENKYNPVVDGKPTYHLDGQIFINEENLYNVTFRVKNPDSESFVIQEDYSKIVRSGYSEANLARPGTEDKTYEGETYTFDGWYLDEACTVKANFDGTITENRNYYGRYIPKEDKLLYDGNGAESGSTGPTVGNYGGTVKVAENGFVREGYEFTGWNTKPDGSGTTYKPGDDYQLTPEEDVLYAQWWKWISPPTGVAGNGLPYVMMVAVAIGAAICFGLFHLKKRTR